ncbi:MAG: DNA polymerase III subunit delta [Legionellaceae bacterium]|nr:DNA polymerase III subunit delta [Legionellaceae bacterium]
MIIKSQALEANVAKKIYPLYLLTGQDQYLLNSSAQIIKSKWAKCYEYDEDIIEFTNNDWEIVFDKANNYSLFSEAMLLDIRFNKKSMDAAGKKAILKYLNNYNDKCLIIIRAPNIPTKQLQWLTKDKNCLITQAMPYTPIELENWIKSELQKQEIRHDKDVPKLIFQYSQNNMLAASQVIQKLSLINDPEKVFSSSEVLQYISDQSEYPIYDLANACLAAKSDKCISILNKISQNKGEPVYILWILTQEIRLLLQISNLISQRMSMSSACSQLNIWSQRMSLYDMTLKRLSKIHLEELLQYCATLDETIKSNRSNCIWDKLQQLALLICFGWKLQ